VELVEGAAQIDAAPQAGCALGSAAGLRRRRAAQPARRHRRRWGGVGPQLAEWSEEERAPRCALAALHAWGVDPPLDAQLAAECGGSSGAFAPALGGAEGAATLLTPAGAASQELLRASPRFVAARSLAMAAMAQGLQRLGERGRTW